MIPYRVAAALAYKSIARADVFNELLFLIVSIGRPSFANGMKRAGAVGHPPEFNIPVPCGSGAGPPAESGPSAGENSKG